MSRTSVLYRLGAALATPSAVLAASRNDQNRAFVTKCDEVRSVERLTRAPRTRAGTTVHLYGIVGPDAPLALPNFRLVSPDDPKAVVIVVCDDDVKSTLAERQRVRVRGVVRGSVDENTWTSSGMRVNGHPIPVTVHKIPVVMASHIRKVAGPPPRC